MSIHNHTKGANVIAPKVFIATPTYSGKLDVRFVHALMRSIPALDAEGIAFEFFTVSYNCHVDDARNDILTKFRESDCGQLVFIDADVSFEPESLIRLIRHDRDIVAGVYPKRSLQDLNFPVLVEPGLELWADESGLVEVSGAPTGFMKIKRHVIERLCELNASRTYLNKASKPGDIPSVIVFERTFEDGQRFSGDYSFCRAWRKLGGKVFVDPEMLLTHKGEVEFSGTLGDFWKEKHGIIHEEKRKRFASAVENLRAGNCSETDVINLSDGWGNPFAAHPDLLAACYWLAKQSKGSAVESGSGLSTLVMALANPELTIHCLEHEIIWAARLKHEMKVHKIENIVVHLADLKSYESGNWYNTDSLPKENFSLALCDGPPRKLGNRSIFYQALGSQIKDAVILMDDADDDLAVAPIKEWASANGHEVTVLGGKRRFAVSQKMEAKNVDCA